MKLFVACFLGVVVLSVALPNSPSIPHSSRGCRYIMGRCVEECPEGTHAYTTGCGPLTPEATCDSPHPVQGRGSLCDYSSCYCDAPTVRHPHTKKCVPLEECPKKE